LAKQMISINFALCAPEQQKERNTQQDRGSA